MRKETDNICGTSDSFFCLPYLHGLIIACRDEILPIRRPGHSCNPVIMTSIGIDMCTCFGVPDLHSSIVTCSSKKCSARRPSDTSDTICMFIIVYDTLSHHVIPELCHSIIKYKGKQLTI